jgi:ElaB/YqjD/DUF883 family membrane-anchored ribosome-binding protein
MSRGTGKDQVSVDKLLDDLQAVVADAEALLKATAHQAGEKVQEARAKAEESLTAAREHLDDVQDGALHQAREWLGSCEEYVRRNPWQAVGIAAGAGLLIGLLVSLNRRQ